MIVYHGGTFEITDPDVDHSKAFLKTRPQKCDSGPKICPEKCVL